MCWLKRDRWKTGIALAGMLLLILMVWVPASAASAYEGTSGLATPEITGIVQATPTVDPTMTALQREQLTQQINQLKLQNDRSIGAWLWNSGTIVAALLALLGVALTAGVNFQQWKKSETDTLDKDRTARQDALDKDRTARQDALDKELRDRAEERFKTAVTALEGEREGAQVGGAILLRSFLNKDDEKIYGRYYTQIFDLAAAHLRLSSTSQPPKDPNTPLPLTPLRQALISVFKEAFPLARDQLKEQDPKTHFNPQALDAGGVKLDEAYLGGADLKQAWIPEAFLREAILSGADLSEANLNSANLKGASILDTCLVGAQLIQATLTKAHLYGADLSKASLFGANLFGSSLNATKLNGADLSRAYLAAARFCRADPKEFLNRTDLQERYGIAADLSEAKLVNASLIFANFGEANLSKADLRGADLRGANFEEADLRGSNLSGAKFTELDLGKFLGDPDFEGKFNKVSVDRADLSGANMSKADLSGIRDLEDVRSLQGTDLRGVTGLTQEQLESCKARGAIIDEDTKTSPLQSPVSPHTPEPHNDAQAPSAPSAQVKTSFPDTERNGAASSKHGPES